MTGEQLYAEYAKEHEARDCTIDPWDQIEERERFVWNALALRIIAWGAAPRLYEGLER